MEELASRASTRSRAVAAAPRSAGRRVAALALVTSVLLLAQGGQASALTAPLFGVTIDRISALRAMRSALAGLPHRATTRVYFDIHEPAAYYASALASLHGVSAIMGEPLDSSEETSISTAALRSRVQEYLGALSGSVDIWEIGNEVNGNWTGDYGIVSEKLTAAFDAVSASGGRAALTLYANNFGPENCGDGTAELTPTQFSERYVPARVATGLDYVLLSYYPSQCGGREPSSGELKSALEALHAIYPNAALGFGEVGLPRHVTRSSRAKAEQIMRWAYSLSPGLPYYIGGYFWWYGAEDALRARSPLHGALRAAFEAEFAALG
jgi:hypothetical protein